MVRPHKLRRIAFHPRVLYFKPQAVPLSLLEEVALHRDELEALRWCDVQGLQQQEAAEKMNISQSTLHRLLLAARQKIADALITGKAVRIETGDENLHHYIIRQKCRRPRRHTLHNIHQE